MMKALGLTNLVRIDGDDDWQKVRKHLIQAGCRPVNKRRGQTDRCPHLVDRGGKVVTDRDGDHASVRYVELSALLETGFDMTGVDTSGCTGTVADKGVEDAQG